MEITFPVKEVTAVAFGGPNLDILYVITASAQDKSESAGCLFKVTGLGAKGYPGVKVSVWFSSLNEWIKKIFFTVCTQKILENCLSWHTIGATATTKIIK